MDPQLQIKKKLPPSQFFSIMIYIITHRQYSDGFKGVLKPPSHVPSFVALAGKSWAMAKAPIFGAAEGDARQTRAKAKDDAEEAQVESALHKKIKSGRRRL